MLYIRSYLNALWYCFAACGVSYFGFVFKFLGALRWVQLNVGWFQLGAILKWLLLAFLTAYEGAYQRQAHFMKEEIEDSIGYHLHSIYYYCGFISYTKNHLFS